MKRTVKLVAGKRYVDCILTENEKRYSLKFPYNKRLLRDVKMFQGRKFDWDSKIWSFPKSRRNDFQLSRLMGQNPYERYDLPLITFTPKREELRTHQRDMTSHILTRRQCIIAGEMGVGKTLSAIEAAEYLGIYDLWYVAPKWALHSVHLEMRKWKTALMPKMFTYDGFKKEVANWEDGKVAPAGIIFDECQFLKTITSQRTQSALAIAEGMRQDHKDPMIVLMSGTPAPKNPLDWYPVCEIACPGFLIEGDIHKFKETLAVVKMEEGLAGGQYPKLVSWRSSSDICDICGERKESDLHDTEMIDFDPEVFHEFKASVNEVERLYRRITNGLVMVKLKKDCADLPEMIYNEVRLQPSEETLNLAKLIMAKSASAIKTLTLLRELSDGFQYKDIESGKMGCSACDAHGYVAPIGSEQRTEVCPRCEGSGKVPKYNREAVFIGSPKIDALKELLEAHDNVKRLVIFAGFTGSIDICQKTCHELDWKTIRVDGRGMSSPYGGASIETFQSDCEDKIAYVAYAGSGGMGLTLTKSPSIVYYSNSFNGNDRMQSEARIHRLGMDENRSPNVYDLLHLPADEYVLRNLKLKKDLQSVTLGELQEVFNEGGLRYV